LRLAKLFILTMDLVEQQNLRNVQNLHTPHDVVS